MTFVEDSYRRLHPQLWRCLLGYCGDVELASEVEVKVYQEALGAKSGVGRDSPTTFDTWVWRAAFSEADKRLTKEGIAIQPGDDGLRAVVERRTLSHPEYVHRQNRLSGKQRRIVLLGSVGELNVDRIAEIMATTSAEIQVELQRLDPFPDQLKEADPPDVWPLIIRRRGNRWPTAARQSAAAWLLAMAVVTLVVSWLARPSGPVPGTANPTLQPRPGIAQVQREEIEPPDLPMGFRRATVVLSATESDVAVFDIRIDTGERFRLTVPRRFESELEWVSTTGIPRSLVLFGRGSTEIRINFRRCQNVDLMSNNSGGSLIHRPKAGTVAFCRPDDLLSSTVNTLVVIDDADLELFDVRPIDVGTAYRRHLATVVGTGVCPDCSPSGPVRYGDVVVNRTGDGSLSAVSIDDLSRQWTISRPGVELTLLGARPASRQRSATGEIWVVAPGRAVSVVEAETGKPRWEVELEDGESRFELYGMGDEPWVLASSFDNEGDNRPPRLRRIDPISGEVVWSAEGRAGAVWAWNGVAFDDNTLFAADVFNDPEAAAPGRGSMIEAFALEDGDSVFAVELDAPEGAFTTRRVVYHFTKDENVALLASTAHGLLARLDPETGELFWSTRINPGGPSHLVQFDDGSVAIRVTTSLNDHLYDLETGHRLIDSAYR